MFQKKKLEWEMTQIYMFAKYLNICLNRRQLRLKARREGDNRRWDGWMPSLTQWTWVWTGSRRWWRTGKLGVLQSMGSQGVRHDWATEQQDTQVCSIVSNSFDPMDCSPPGSSVCGISQARILEWVAIFSSSGSSWLRDWIQVSWVSCIGRWILYHLSHLGIPALNLLQCVVFVEGQVENLASYQLTSWKKTILIFQIKVSIFLWYSTKALPMVISQIFVAKWNLKASMNFHINCFIAGLSCTLNSSFIQAWFCDIK